MRKKLFYKSRLIVQSNIMYNVSINMIAYDVLSAWLCITQAY